MSSKSHGDGPKPVFSHLREAGAVTAAVSQRSKKAPWQKCEQTSTHKENLGLRQRRIHDLNHLNQ